MKRIIFVSFLTINIFLVGCNAQNNEMTFIEPTQDERIEQNVGDEVHEATSESSEKQRTIMTYDEGHQQLQKVIDKLNEHADGLGDRVPVDGRGDYIGYIYSTDNLYKYLLAIYYKGEDVLDSNYPYNYWYDSFDELTKIYHEYVDFSSIELEGLKHDFDIEIELSYKNKSTNEKGYLKYFISYGKHELKDLSDFYQ